jgi:hypothetical protein
MKSIKAIKSGKDFEVGEIKRVDDRSAQNMVGIMWQYISKSEWKQATRKTKSTVQVSEQPTDQVTDQVEKKPYKKGQKSEKHKNKN